MTAAGEDNNGFGLPIKRNGSMAKKARSPRARKPKIDLAKDLWISPRLNLRGKDGDRGWDRSGNLPPGAGARFLELADIALGIKKPSHLKKKTEGPLAHETTKKEPYSL